MSPARQTKRGFVGLVAGTAISAVLIAAAQLVQGAAGVAFLALVPWLMAIRSRPVAVATASGLAVGTLAALGVGLWLPAALVAFGATPLESVAGYLITTVLVAGVPYAIVGASLGAMADRHSELRLVAVASALFLTDLARGHGYGVPWMLLGHTQAGMPGIAQIAVLGGVPLISALVGAINVVIAQWVGSGRPASAGPLAGAALGVIVLGVPVAEGFRAADSASDIRVLAIQPNIPIGERWFPAVQHTSLDLVSRLTADQIGRGLPPDLIVWPETTLTNPIDRQDDLREALLAAASELPAPLVLGVVESGSAANRYRSAALWVDPVAGVGPSVHKVRGVPIVESGAPFPGSSLIRAAVGQSAESQRLEPVELAEALSVDGRSFIVVFCYEAIFPDLVARQRTPDSLAILNLANDSWFSGDLVSRQQIAFSSFRAIEERLPLLRVAHGGISASVDPMGRVVETIPFDTEGSMSVVLARSAPPSAWERLAFGGLLLGGAAVGWAVERLLGRTPR